MIINPVNIQIVFAYGSSGSIEVIPIYRDNGSAFVPTGAYQLFEGCTLSDTCSDEILENEKYQESIEIMGAAHPGYLGELQFNGFWLFEWKYIGYYLSEGEVCQIVSALQDFDSDAIVGN